MTPINENTGDETHIDSGVFDNAELLSDDWLDGTGQRLYKLADRIGNHPPIHAITEYERKVSQETGEMVEKQTLKGIGRIVPNIDLRTGEQQILDRLEDENEPGYEFWDETTVEMMLREFETYIENRIPELMEQGELRKLVDLPLPNKLRIAVDEDNEVFKLATSSSIDEIEWHSFLWAVREETPYIDPLIGDDVETDAEIAYAFIPEFEPVANWRLRAVENTLCGVFKNAPALANVSALLNSDSATTQAEIAAELDKDESTISQQVSDVTDWRERAQWMCKNRL